MKAGDAIVFASAAVHGVTPVTRGTRRVMVRPSNFNSV